MKPTNDAADAELAEHLAEAPLMVAALRLQPVATDCLN